jgi:hypothetical protein
MPRRLDSKSTKGLARTIPKRPPLVDRTRNSETLAAHQLFNSGKKVAVTKIPKRLD